MHLIKRGIWIENKDREADVDGQREVRLGHPSNLNLLDDIQAPPSVFFSTTHTKTYIFLLKNVKIIKRNFTTQVIAYFMVFNNIFYCYGTIDLQRNGVLIWKMKVAK